MNGFVQTEKGEQMDDSIRRQVAINVVKEYQQHFRKYIGTPEDNEMYAYARGLLMAIEAGIERLPEEVEPAKRGRWVIRPHKMMGECPCCSECGCFNPIEYRYCPNCGAQMEGGDEDADKITK